MGTPKVFNFQEMCSMWSCFQTLSWILSGPLPSGNSRPSFLGNCLQLCHLWGLYSLWGSGPGAGPSRLILSFLIFFSGFILSFSFYFWESSWMFSSKPISFLISDAYHQFPRILFCSLMLFFGSNSCFMGTVSSLIFLKFFFLHFYLTELVSASSGFFPCQSILKILSLGAW